MPAIPAGISQRRIVPKRPPDLNTAGSHIGGNERLIVWGQYACNREVSTAEIDGLAHDLWIGIESPLPQAIAEEHHEARGRLVILRRKISSRGHLDAEGAEIIVRHAKSDKLLRLTGRHQRWLPLPIESEFFKTLAARFPVFIGCKRCGARFAVVFSFTDHDEAVRVREWQRMEKHAVDDAE